VIMQIRTGYTPSRFLSYFYTFFVNTKTNEINIEIQVERAGFRPSFFILSGPHPRDPWPQAGMAARLGDLYLPAGMASSTRGGRRRPAYRPLPAPHHRPFPGGRPPRRAQPEDFTSHMSFTFRVLPSHPNLQEDK